MPKQPTHPSPEELKAYNLGQLPQDQAVVIDDHISECRPCCETMVGLSSDDTFLAQLQDADQMAASESHSASATAIPTALAEHPRYETQELVGRGGMGDVYKARHRMMDRMVAVKIINRTLVSKPEVVDRFHREVKAAAQLSHANLVAAYDAEQVGDVHLMAMEYVDGIDLSRTVQENGALAVSDACEFVRQAALGLQHAHELGMVHRDIKPHNLMVTADGTVKVLDFGLASLAPEVATTNEPSASDSELTAAGTIMGTPDFISPEQAKDAHQADIRSDIYSLGATFYFLLAGRPPFADGTVMDKLKSHAQVEPTDVASLRDDVPPELASVVSRMIAKSPEDRYQTPAAVADALGTFCGYGSKERDTPRTGWFVGLAVLFAGLLAGLSYYNLSSHGTVRVEISDPSLEVFVDDRRIAADEDGLGSLSVDVGMQKLRVRQVGTSLMLETPEFEIRAGKGQSFQVELYRDKIVVRNDTGVFASFPLAQPTLPRGVAQISKATGMRPEEFQAKTKAALAKAAGIPLGQWNTFAAAPHTKRSAIQGEPLTLVLLELDSLEAAQKKPAALSDFRCLTDGRMTTGKLQKVISQSSSAGFVSMLQPSMIKLIEFKLPKKPEQTLYCGQVEFEAPLLYAGKVEFLLNSLDGELNIREFTLPNYGVVIARNDKGEWHRKLIANNATAPDLPFTLGKQTTHITEPLTKDGYPDYVEALNAKHSDGVTVDNNANVIFRQARRRDDRGVVLPDAYFAALGVAPPKDTERDFQNLREYLRAADGEDQDRIYDQAQQQQRQACEMPWKPQQFPHLDAWLKVNESKLPAIVSGTKRPHFYAPIVFTDETDVTRGFLSSPGNRLLGFARAILCRAMLRAEAGRYEEAWDDILACYRLGRLIGQDPRLEELFTAYAIDRLASQASLGIIRHEKLDAKQLQARLAEIRQLPAMGKLVDKIDYIERWRMLESMMFVIRQSANGKEVKELGPLMNSLTQFPAFDWDTALRNTNQRFDMATRLLRAGDRAKLAEFGENFVDEMKTAARELQKLSTPAERKKILDDPARAKQLAGKAIENLLASLLFPDVSHLHNAKLRWQQSQHNVQLAFALAMYRLKHKAYPDELSALVPAYFAEIPADEFSGESLSYRKSEQGYLLYSKGANGIDEQAEAGDEAEFGDDVAIRMNWDGESQGGDAEAGDGKEDDRTDASKAPASQAYLEDVEKRRIASLERLDWRGGEADLQHVRDQLVDVLTNVTAGSMPRATLVSACFRGDLESSGGQLVIDWIGPRPLANGLQVKLKRGATADFKFEDECVRVNHLAAKELVIYQAEVGHESHPRKWRELDLAAIDTVQLLNDKKLVGNACQFRLHQKPQSP